MTGEISHQRRGEATAELMQTPMPDAFSCISKAANPDYFLHNSQKYLLIFWPAK